VSSDGDGHTARPGDCESIRERLSDYLDGRAGPGAPDKAEIASHLDECEACREYLADIEAISAGFRHTDEDDRVPAGRIVAAAMEMIARGETGETDEAIETPAPVVAAAASSHRRRPAVRLALGFGAAVAASAAVWVVVAVITPGGPERAPAGPEITVTVPVADAPFLGKGGGYYSKPGPVRRDDRIFVEGDLKMPATSGIRPVYAEPGALRTAADLAVAWEVQKIADDRRAEELLGLAPQAISFDEERTVRSLRRRSLDDAAWLATE